MDGNGHPLPLEWPHPGPYGYNPYTNTFLPLTYYGYGYGVEYSWDPAYQQQGTIPAPYFSSSVLGGGPPMAGPQRGRGRGCQAQRGRGGRGSRAPRAPRQHGGPGLLGSDPSCQPPAQVQPPVPAPAPLPSEKREPTPPPPPASSSPSSHAMTPPVPDLVQNSHVVAVSMTAAKMDADAGQEDVLVGLSGSSTAATGKKRLLPGPLKNSDVDASMARRDASQGDVLGLKFYKAKRRLISKKASSLPADAYAVEEGKDTATKKTRLGWGQGLAKYENHQYKKDDETTPKLVAHDGEAASSHGSSPPLGSKGPGDKNSLDDMDEMDEMRVSDVTTAPALLSKGSSTRPLTGDLGDPRNNGSIGSLTEKAVDLAKVPARARSSRKHRPSPAANDNKFKADGSIGDLHIVFPKVYAVPRKDSTPPEDNSNNNSSKTATAVSALASSSQGCEAPPDESSMKFTKVQDVPSRIDKVVVKMLQKPRKIMKMNVLSDEEPETDDLQGSKLKERSQEECHKEAQKCLPTTVMQSQENCSDENDAATLLSGTATVKATKNSERMKAKAEDAKKPVNQICHESTANLLAHSLPDKGHGESSMDENEHVSGKVLLGESNAAASPLGIRSSQAVGLTISETEAPVLENFNEDSCSNEAVCTTKSSSKVKENVLQSVPIANHGDEGNFVAGGSFGQDTFKIIFFPDERSAKLANDSIKGDQITSGAKTAELCSSLKECNNAAKHHSWKATEKKLANSNIDDGRMAPSEMKDPKSKGNPCITSDPAAMLTGPAFVQHMMEVDEAMEKKESETNDDNVKGKEGNNPVVCVASKHGSGIQLSCEVNSQKEMEKVDSIPSPEGNDVNADMETPTKDSSPCVDTNASVVRDDGLIQPLRASEEMHRNPENNDAKVTSNEGNPVDSVASKERNGIQLSCNVTAEKGKGIMPSPEVNSGSAALDMVHANSSYVAMDIDLNTPLDVTSVDLGSSTTEASMGRSSDATDSDATMEMISPLQTTTTATQTAQQQPANQPGSILLFGRVIYQAPSTGTTNHTPNQGIQTVVSSSNMPSNRVVRAIRPRGRGQAYASWATATSIWRSSVPNNQQGQQAMLSNRILYGSSTNGASASAASQLQLQPAGSSALMNMMNQHRQQALPNIAPNSIMRGGGVPVVQIPGNNGAAGFVNFNAFNSVQQQWPYHVVDTTRVMVGHPAALYYHGGTANQAPATVTTALSVGTNNGEGASTSNARAQPAEDDGRGSGGTGGHNSWLSLRRD